MTLEVVALVDDNEEGLEQWCTSLRDHGMEPIAFKDADSFDKCLARGDHFDAVVLDWNLNGDTPILAKLTLERIRTHRFVPVLVYTEQADIARDEIKELDSPFDRMEVMSKDAVDASQLPEKLTNWYSTTGARIAAIWRNVRRIAFEQALYELDALEGKDLHVALRHLVESSENPYLDIDHTIDFLEKLVGRKIPANYELRVALEQVLNSIEPFDKKAVQQIGYSKALVNAHRYIPIDDKEEVIHTGDIIDVYSNGENKFLLTGVVITPACDLENRKCRELRILVADKAPAEHTAGAQWHHLPAIKRKTSGEFEDYWLNFHRSLCIYDTSLELLPPKDKGARPSQWNRLLSYKTIYNGMFGNAVKLQPVCRLDDPYRSDLLQKYSSHAARVGTPDG